MGSSIQGEIGYSQTHALGLASAQQRANTSQQFEEREGLAQVILGASVEAGDEVGGGIESRQHQNRRRDSALPQLPCDGITIEQRQHDVQNDGAKHSGSSHLQTLTAVVGQEDGVVLLL